MTKGDVCGIKLLWVEDMQEKAKREIKVGPMQKRTEKMEDGRRYIIYYTFDEAPAEATPPDGEPKDQETGESNV